MQTPPHIKLVTTMPGYTTGLRKRSKKQIQKIMHEHGFDDDFIEAIDDSFCLGFSTARDIAIELLKKQYDAK